MSEMNVLAKLKPEPGLWASTAPVPTIKDDEILIKIKKTAICGTDLHIYNWDKWAQSTIPVPMHVGHEFVGEIVETGAEVIGFKVGDRVSGEGHIVCGHCRNCRGGKQHLCRNTLGVGVNRPGCFAEYLSIPARNTYVIPDDISDDTVSIFDPLGNAVHTALSFDLTGEDVLITGAGPVGLLAAAVVRHVGARHIVISDVNDYRLKIAKSLGVSLTVNVRDCKDGNTASQTIHDAMSELGMTEGFDVGLELSGNNQAIDTMIKTMNNGGKMAFLGFTGEPTLVNWDDIIWKGLHLKGIYGREMFETWYKMTAMLQSGLNVDPVITHNMHYTEYEEGFKLMNSGQCGKVVLDW